MGLLKMDLIFLVLYLGLINLCYSQPPQYLCGSTDGKGDINSALLTLNTLGVDSTIVLQLVSKECYMCDLQNITYMEPDQSSCTVIVDTRWPSRISVISNSTTDKVDEGCFNGSLDKHLREGGNYSIYVTYNTTIQTITCRKPEAMDSGHDANIPIYVTFGIFAGLALIWIFYKKRCFWRIMYIVSPNSLERMDNDVYAEHDLGAPTNAIIETDKGKKERLKSLDTFRGISLVIMMFVNYGGANYWFFNHSKWNGITVADLVFPWFVWIMGTAMVYSFHSINRKALSKFQVFWKILKRSATLFAFGLLINSGGSKNPVDFDKWRIMGVLQRFALTYLVTATVHMFCSKSIDSQIKKWWSPLRDIFYYWPEWIINSLIVLVHLLLTFLLRVDGCPIGYIGPGGLAKDAGNDTDVSLCTGGAAAFIDKKVFGPAHVYGHPTCSEIYNSTQPYDPEGLLGTLTSCFLCFIGLQAGKILLLFKETGPRICRFLIWAIVLGLLALLLCNGKQNGGWIPINKNLWSLSFVLAMSGMAFILLTFCYLMIDHYKIWTGAPFYYPGMNSIVIYMCHEMFSQPLQSFWNINPESHAIFMLINVIDVGLWVFLSYFLYCKKIFISV